MCQDGGRQQARQGTKKQTGGHPIRLILAQGNSTHYLKL